MSRRKIISKKDSLDKIKKLQEEEERAISIAHPPIVKNSGGAINNLPVATEEYKKWLVEKQERNPFIGSQYIAPAPELNSESEMQGDITEEDASEEMLDSSKANAHYNPDDDTEEVFINPEIEAIKKDASDNKYIDFCIVENTTKKLLGKPLEDIENDVQDELKKYHNNDEYVSEIDVSRAIINTERLLIENQKNDIKMLDPNKNNDDT